jgi:LuxR family maltose regulon positive regulatory protein
VNSSVLATKLHRPVTPSRWVPRPQLIQRLNEGLESGRRITLVSAPAGFGKTTCIGDWVDTLDLPVTWLSLDPADDDPGRFFTYFIAALQKVHANLGRDVEGALGSGQLPPGEVISATFVNDILNLEARFLFVLDDLQVIQDPFILQVLETLVANLPQAVHLVLITREDPPLPLARLRAHNQLTEIRAHDLRFARPDAERFLNAMLDLSLARADVAVLHDKTEGWIAGLQLAALALQSPISGRDRADPADFIATLSGSHRFILNYLTEEVLSKQPEEIQRFLLQTSILDKLNGDLCNAVTGRSDSPALLERLLNANLFLIPLDDEGRWYRYHHLFADLLRDLVPRKEGVAELHRRASHWYAQEGMGEGGAFVNEAIQHALAAKDYALVVDLLERHSLSMIMQGYAKTVNAWLQAMPAEWASSSLRTQLAFAWMHLLRGTYSQSSLYLERLEESFAGPGLSQEERLSLKAEWLVMHSLLLSSQGKITESLDSTTHALQIVPEADDRVRSLAYFGLACGHQALDEYDLAVDAYKKAIRHGRAAENSITLMMSTSGLAQLAFEHGQLHLAFEIAAPVCDRLEQSGPLPPISTVVFGMVGEVRTQWLEIETARHYIQRALQLSALGGYNSGMIGCRVLLSRLSQLEGDLEGAAEEIGRSADLMKVDTPDYVRQEALAQQVRVYLAKDRPAQAEMALQQEGFSFEGRFSSPDLPPDQGVGHSIGLLYNSSLRVLLYQPRTRGDPAGLRRGIELADELIARALQGRTLLVALETLLLRAQLHAALGNSHAGLATDLGVSRADYGAALDLAEPEGILGVFVEQGPPVAEALARLVEQQQLQPIQTRFAQRILDAFSRSQPPRPTPVEQLTPDLPARSGTLALIEPLTERELEVLGLMTQGLKYKEIADRLVISLNTVRSHVKAIYGKLQVNNRMRAVEVARQLQIL